MKTETLKFHLHIEGDRSAGIQSQHDVVKVEFPFELGEECRERLNEEIKGVLNGWMNDACGSCITDDEYQEQREYDRKVEQMQAEAYERSKNLRKYGET